jgi:oligopeptide transport system permease protein
MAGYLFKKGIILLLSLWAIVTGTFFLMHAVPGDPFIGDRVIPEEALRSLYAYYGLDQPLWKQYCVYLKGICQGDLGPSIVYQGRRVNEFIREGFPISFLLGFEAICIALPLGVFLGTWAALKKNQWQDTLCMFVSALGISVPNFVLSSLLQFFFSVQFHWLPVARWGGIEHMVLPVIALAALPTAFIARLTRSNMIEVMGQDYIRTARAKGLPLFQIALRHGLRNALLPVVGYLGPLVSHVLTGSFVIEKIFAIPGLGQWMIHSINGRDYPMILGLTLFFSTLLIVCTFLVDLLYVMLDPRIRLSKQRSAYG